MKFNDLSMQWAAIEAAALPKLVDVLKTGNFILGSPVSVFEKAFAAWNGNTHAIGVANGTDALKICVRALDLKGKSKFYVPANTYIATLLGVVFSLEQDYEYELIDCDSYFQMDCSVLENSLKRDSGHYDNLVVMPVHLYGHCCDMVRLMDMKSRYAFKMIEDCSQAHGTVSSEGKKVGQYGEVSAFSLYPGKNLGAAGDAGIIVTNDNDIAQRCLYLRNLGSAIKYQHDVIGWNSRLDTVQAVILNEKLQHMDSWNASRNRVAEQFSARINNPHIVLPKKADYCEYHTYHIYPILTKHREAFMKHLSDLEIPTLIHYPIPIEKTKAFSSDANNINTIIYSEQLVSLPMHPFLTDEEITHIVDGINSFHVD
jgi:dTDP-4-amino-4,6-dideoxygalactose transaminase